LGADATHPQPFPLGRENAIVIINNTSPFLWKGFRIGCVISFFMAFILIEH